MVGEQLFLRRHFNDLAQVHHHDPFAHVLDHAEIMRNKKIGQGVLPLQVNKQIQDLRPDGNIQRGHRFVSNENLWIEHERPCNADSLPLPAAKLVRIPIHVFRLQSYFL